MSKPETPGQFITRCLLDIGAPFVGYFVVHFLGAPAFWALTAAGLAAAASTAVNTIRRKGLDRLGVLMILELATSLALFLFMHDRRLLLVRPSFYTAVAALTLLFTVWVGRPLSFDTSRPIAARGGPARLAAYERSWQESPAFRRTHRLVTLGMGLALACDAVLRVLVVYRFPLERSLWLAQLPHIAATVLIVAASALAGRTFKRIVDEQMARASTP